MSHKTASLLVPETYAVSGSLEDIRRALALEILKFLKHGEYSAEGSKGELVYGGIWNKRKRTGIFGCRGDVPLIVELGEMSVAG